MSTVPLLGPLSELVEAAQKLAGDQAIVWKTGECPDGQRLIIAVAVGPAAERWEKIILANGDLDPRSTADGGVPA